MLETPGYSPVFAEFANRQAEIISPAWKIVLRDAAH